MPTQLLLVKLDDSLHPTDEASIDALRQIKDNAIVSVKISIPRSAKHHRLFWALLQIVFQAQREPRQFATTDGLLDAIKLATGHMREVKDLHGKIHYIPDSISFGRMSQPEFREFFDSAVRVILDRILPGVQKADLENQIYHLLKEPSPSDLEIA